MKTTQWFYLSYQISEKNYEESTKPLQQWNEAPDHTNGLIEKCATHLWIHGRGCIMLLTSTKKFDFHYCCYFLVNSYAISFPDMSNIE